MSDQTTPTYPQPRWRIAATFAATDGHTPETIEVECSADDVDGVAFVTAAIRQLAEVAAGRSSWLGTVQDATRGGTITLDPRAVAGAADLVVGAAQADLIGRAR